MHCNIYLFEIGRKKMGLFKSKRTEITDSCCCGGKTEEIVAEGANHGKRIKILGSGCAKCRALERAVTDALEELGEDVAVEHVTDYAQIASYGVMSTPALVIDGKVLSYGKVLGKEEAKSILRKALG